METQRRISRLEFSHSRHLMYFFFPYHIGMVSSSFRWWSLYFFSMQTITLHFSNGASHCWTSRRVLQTFISLTAFRRPAQSSDWLHDDRQMDEWMDWFSLDAGATCCLWNGDYTVGYDETTAGQLTCGYTCGRLMGRYSFITRRQLEWWHEQDITTFTIARALW